MRAICLGEALIDFIAEDAVPLSEATRFVRCLGGAAVNVAVGLHCNGFSTTLVSRVGRDMLGKQVLHELNQWGLSTEFVQIDPQKPTKCSFISHDTEGNRYIEIANRQSADQHIDSSVMQAAFVDDVDLLYISGVMLIREAGLDLVMSAVQAAKEKKALIAFDPVFDVSRAAESVKKRIFEILKCVDILKVNDAEYQAIERVLSHLDSCPDLILHTKGDQGAVIRNGRAEAKIRPINTAWVDPTGAGDAFLTGFLTHLMQEKGQVTLLPLHLSKYGENGALNASQIIQKIGGNSGYK